MTLAAAVLAAVGSPSAYYVPAALLPPVESMRFKRVAPRHRREAGSGTTIVGGRIDASAYDTNAETQGSKWYGSMGRPGVSAEMMRHPHIRQSIGYITNPLRAATWWFKPASKSPLDREVADHCNWCFLEQLPWDTVLERMVRGYGQDGFALSEMTDAMLPIPADRFPNHPGKGVGLTPTGLHEIPANTVDQWHPRKGAPTQLDHITQWQPYTDDEKTGWRDIKADRIVRITYEQTGADFSGVAVLRSLYGPWKMLRAFETYRSIGFERTAVGTPVVIAGEDVVEEKEIDAIELLLENMRTMAKGSMVLPHGCEISWEGGGENDLDNLNKAIESIKTDIAVNSSAGFTRLGLTGPGSYALGVTLANPYHLSIVGHSNLFAISFNIGVDGWSPVRRIVTANWGADVPVPTLQARNLPTRDIKTVLPLIYNGITVRAITPDDPLEEEIRDMVQVGPADPATARKGASASVGFGVNVPPPGPDDGEEEEQKPEPEPPPDDGVAPPPPDDDGETEDE